jgi:hypothetical protein
MQSRGIMSETDSAARNLAAALEAVRLAHFDASGTWCDYAALARAPERERLETALAALAAFDPRRATIPVSIGFWLNAYNACVLTGVLEVGLPTSVNDIAGFFESECLRIAGLGFSLDDIEHGLLRGNVHKHGKLRGPMAKDDPRLAFTPLIYDERMHFALYSASRSSPALRAFHAGGLERELEDAAGEYLRKTVRVEQDGAILVVPKVFDWYAADFGGENGVLEFVMARIDDDSMIDAIDRRAGRVRLRYAEFDWTLNAKA